MSSVMEKDFPEDVLMDIFARLPVKSLLQFKCVCKSWCNLIKDPIFITKHVNQFALSNNGYLAVTSQGGTFGGKCPISLISYETFREVIKITLPSKERGNAPFRIVGSNNGVMCLNNSTLGDTNFLFNPATSEFKKLPKPDDLLDQHVEGFDLIGLGFGYDPESNDYKLVRFSYSTELEVQIYSEIDVYLLNTNSWRRKDMPVPGVIFENSFSKAVINGALHWRGLTKIRGFYSFLILSFGIKNEVTQYLEVPEIDLDGDGKEWYPFDRNGSLAIVISSTDYQGNENIFYKWGYRNSFDIWVMNEYGVEESWTKQLTVGPLSAHSLVGFGKNEELLFEFHSMMLLYDLQQVKTPHDDLSWANIIGDNFVHCIEAVNHIESLVTIEGTKIRAKRVCKNSRFVKDFIFFVLRFVQLVFTYFFWRRMQLVFT